MQRFGGIARLYGNASLQTFLNARIAVIGVGGIGSWAVESLARSGIGHITLVDLDEICITNVNRQLHAMDGQIGRQKTEAMAERAKAIHPNANIEVISRFFNESSANEILDTGFDGVIDAIDQTHHKTLLVAECHKRGFHTVTCGAAGGRRDPTKIRVNDLAYSGKDPLLHRLRKSLRNDYHFPKIAQRTTPPPLGIEAVYSEEEPYYAQCDGNITTERPENAPKRLGCDIGFGSVTHVTATFGMIAASRILEHLMLKADRNPS